jgi:hypothetical protein
MINAIDLPKIDFTPRCRRREHTFSTNSIKPLLPTLLFGPHVAQLTNSTDLTLSVLLMIGAAIFILHLLSMILT